MQTSQQPSSFPWHTPACLSGLVVPKQLDPLNDSRPSFVDSICIKYMTRERYGIYLWQTPFPCIKINVLQGTLSLILINVAVQSLIAEPNCVIRPIERPLWANPTQELYIDKHIKKVLLRMWSLFYIKQNNKDTDLTELTLPPMLHQMHPRLTIKFVSTKKISTNLSAILPISPPRASTSCTNCDFAGPPTAGLHGCVIPNARAPHSGPDFTALHSILVQNIKWITDCKSFYTTI